MRRILYVLDAPLDGAELNLWRRVLGRVGSEGATHYIEDVRPEDKDVPLTAENVGLLYDVIHDIQPDLIVPVGPVALMAVAGFKSCDAWRGYYMAPSERAAICFKRRVEVEYKSSKWCPHGGGLSKKSRAAYEGRCTGADCEGGWLYRKGDPRVMTRNVSEPMLLPDSVVWVMPVLSPVTVNDMIELLPVLSNDLGKVREAAAGRDPDTFPPFDISGGIASTTFAVDIENTMEGVITEVGMCDGKQLLSLDTSTNQESIIRSITWAELLIGHNVPHDYMHLARQMPIKAKLWDTMLAAYMLNPDGKKGLNWVISQYIHTQRHKHLAGTQRKLYNAMDVWRTWQLYAPLREGLRQTDQLEFFEGAMMPALPTLVRMTERGIRLDKEWLAGWEKELTADTIRMFDEAPTDMQPIMTKPAKLAALFGLKNTDESTILGAIARGHARSMDLWKILDYREAKKNLGTYATPHLGADRVHPHYLPGARDTDLANKGIAYSGRPTAHDPNIQNQPRDGVARRMFLADSGYRLISLDWSQIEPRITAWLAKDEVLAADLDSTEGIYGAVSNTLQCDRSVAKTVVLLSAYLGSPKVLQQQLALNGIVLDYKSCKALQDRMFDRYRGWAAWRERVIEESSRNRTLLNPFGKRAWFYRPRPAKAVNFLPQSTAASILWWCLPQVEAAIARYGGQMLTTVHDEILVQAPCVGQNNMMVDVAAAARRVMETEWEELGLLSGQPFRVPVKVKVGSNWKEMAAA